MKPKEFQKSTIRAVIDAFDRAGSTRRFLVADEPGLGKTVVARGVIACMADRLKAGTLRVLYVCSNQAIAAQNVEQLLGSGARARTGSADRPALLPLDWPTDAAPASREPLEVYSLTPSTAFSSARHPGRGRVEERAFACALIEHRAGQVLATVRHVLRQGMARFDDELREKRREVHLRGADLAFSRFANGFERLLGASVPGAAPGSTWKRLEDVAIESVQNNCPNAVTALCRNCLSAAALAELKPDLIIFDEFQRFQELLEVDVTTDRIPPAEALIRDVLTAGKRGKLLMLSATPYEAPRSAVAAAKPVGRSRIAARPVGAARDFYHLLRFLWRDSSTQPEHKHELVRRQFEVRDGELSKGLPESPVARNALRQLTTLLSQVMCRTERPMDSQEPSPQLANLPLTSRDLQGLRGFAAWIKRRPKKKGESLEHAQWIVPLWSSVPLTAQAMGKRYACWAAAGTESLPTELRAHHLQAWQPPEWSNAKLRWLLDALPRRVVSMPWVRPSTPWWPMRAGWNDALQPNQIDGKALVFSRFSATPGAIAGAVSFDLESSAVRSSARARGTYGDGSRTSFRAGGASPAMLRLFFVCDALVNLDPQKGQGPATLDGARARVAAQLRAHFKTLDIVVRRKLSRSMLSMESWLLHLAAPDKTTGRLDATSPAVNAWSQAMLLESSRTTRLTDIHARLTKMLVRGGMPGEIDLDREFRPLVELALGSPGIVLARSLLRHWTNGEVAIDLDLEVKAASGRSKVTPRQLLQNLAVDGLRRYLDRPWFAAALTGRANVQFPDAIQQAVVDGNLEAVLDEHFWFVASTNSKTWPKRIDELQKALQLNGGRSVLHISKEAALRVRANLALPLQAAKDDAKKAAKDKSAAARKRAKQAEARPDTVRHAFNTPFWPMVLTTTSVGQEGLDFHAWCKTIVHWDPAAGPVELEQREGRINRFASLAVRQAVSQQTLVHANRAGAEASAPGWNALCKFANSKFDIKGSSGLAPWWCVPGAIFHQFYPHPAGSRERSQREDLERRRANYRMVLGSSDPLRLLEELEAAGLQLTPDRIAKASLRLGAWCLENPGTDP